MTTTPDPFDALDLAAFKREADSTIAVLRLFADFNGLSEQEQAAEVARQMAWNRRARAAAPSLQAAMNAGMN